MGEMEVLLKIVQAAGESPPTVVLIFIFAAFVAAQLRERRGGGAQDSGAKVVPLQVAPPCRCDTLKDEIDRLAEAVNDNHHREMEKLNDVHRAVLSPRRVS